MTKQEKSYVNAACQFGCVICGNTAEWHHLPMARLENAHVAGYPLCREHHEGCAYPGQSIHSDRMLFEGKYGTELRLMQKTILRVFERSVPF